MLKALWTKFMESMISVLPVTLIVLLLNFTPILSLSTTEAVVFLCSAAALIIGMALFNLGADIAMTPMGEQIGSSLSKSGRFKLLLLICFVMGVFITIAEPDLSVLASQVKDIINSTALTVAIGVGVGLFLVLSVIKIVFRVSLSQMLTFFYLLLFALVANFSQTLVVTLPKDTSIPSFKSRSYNASTFEGSSWSSNIASLNFAP